MDKVQFAVDGRLISLIGFIFLVYLTDSYHNTFVNA
jgi:hypothetical protein